MDTYVWGPVPHTLSIALFCAVSHHSLLCSLYMLLLTPQFCIRCTLWHNLISITLYISYWCFLFVAWHRTISYLHRRILAIYPQLACESSASCLIICVHYYSLLSFALCTIINSSCLLDLSAIFLPLSRLRNIHLSLVSETSKMYRTFSASLKKSEKGDPGVFPPTTAIPVQ